MHKRIPFGWSILQPRDTDETYAQRMVDHANTPSPLPADALPQVPVADELGVTQPTAEPWPSATARLLLLAVLIAAAALIHFII